MNAFPRVFITRRVIKDGCYLLWALYQQSKDKETFSTLSNNFFRSALATTNSQKKILKPESLKCAWNTISKTVWAPAKDWRARRRYDKKIDQVRNILRGNFGAVKTHFKAEMERLATELKFEQAQKIKEKLDAFENYQAKSTVVSTTIRDVDVFSIASDEEEKEAYVNYIKIVNGAIIHTHTQELIKNLDDDDDQGLLSYAIPIIRERFNSIAQEIILPYEVKLEENLSITVPKIGDKKKLLELSQKNAKYFMLQRRKQRASQQRKQTSAERILRTLQKDLNMNQLPLHIECFDNSNMQGSHPVASCVVF